MKPFPATVELIRPTQWIKNGFVFMPLIFSGRLFHPDDLWKVCGIFFAFCMASSAMYILNDYLDMEHDRAHPLKKNRPLASGRVSTRTAQVLTAILLCGVVVTCWAISAPRSAFLLIGTYLVLNVLYSLKLKDIVIVDVLTISTGFLIRVMVGASVISVMVSSWLILCTFSVAILLALGKRRHEVLLLSEDAANHRPVLENYSVSLLDQLVQVVGTSTFIFYCLYSVHGNPAAGIQSGRMMFTIPLATYGVFRYMYLVYHKEDGGSPTALLLTDPPLLGCTILWLIACVAVIYW